MPEQASAEAPPLGRQNGFAPSTNLDPHDLRHHHFPWTWEMSFDATYAAFPTKLFSKKSTFKDQKKTLDACVFLDSSPQSPPSCR
ncbi:MAG: hypothetical protein AB7U75_19780 [Hyphomicrobiaceae bacterium]